MVGFYNVATRASVLMVYRREGIYTDGKKLPSYIASSLIQEITVKIVKNSDGPV